MIPEIKIAIVIPVYKNIFFRDTLKSISNQTYKNFHIYIGNDGSNEEFENIIDESGLNNKITYKKFEENRGHISLATHWNRCLEMVKNESWIWLFSDDDLMESDCVEKVINQIINSTNIRVHKFNSVKLKGNLILKENIFPAEMHGIDFLYYKLNYIHESYAIEYVFHRSLLEEYGYFPEFPLAWCSDDLFWAKVCLNNSLLTVADTRVYWRYSDQNISGRENTKDMSIKKMESCFLFFHEIESLDVFKVNPIVKKWFVHWIFSQYRYLKSFLETEESFYFLNRIKNEIISL